jgi:HlyD family secretion protein
MDRPIFREVALERLSSPEELDRLLRVTDAKAWIAQLTICALTVVAIAWGYFGRIPSVVSGQGVIVRRGGVLNIVSAGSGVVAQLKVKVGDRINVGQVVAEIAQPSMLERRKNAEEALAQARREKDRSHALHLQQANMETAAIERHRANAELEEKHLEQQAELAKENVAAQNQLLAAGIIIKQKAIEASQNLATVQDRIASEQAHLEELQAQEFSIQAKVQEDDAQKEMAIEDLARNLNAVEKDLEIAGKVVSPYRGEVLEVKVSSGTTVGTSDPILSIQPDVQDLEVLLYLPAARAKDVRNGMEARISPSSVKPEEFGFIKGYVTYISDFPDTPAELMHNFQNEVLVKALTGEGPVTGLHVEMERNPKTVSGYQWSSSRGPNLTLSSGTLCTAEVVTRQQRPLELLLPALRKTLGLT